MELDPYYRWHTQKDQGCLNVAEPNVNTNDCPGCQYKSQLLKPLLEKKCRHIKYELEPGLLRFELTNGIKYEALLFGMEERDGAFASIYNVTLWEMKYKALGTGPNQFIQCADSPNEVVEFMLQQASL